MILTRVTKNGLNSKWKTLFIGYNVDTLVIPKHLKELDKDNIIERYLFPIMAARKGTEIIYL